MLQPAGIEADPARYRQARKELQRGKKQAQLMQCIAARCAAQSAQSESRWRHGRVRHLRFA